MSYPRDHSPTPLPAGEWSRVQGAGDASVSTTTSSRYRSGISQMPKKPLGTINESPCSDSNLRPSSRALADVFGSEILAGASAAEDRFGDRLSPQQYATIRQCGELADAWCRLPSSRLSLTHGDLRVDNVLFDQRLERTQAILIDWQMTGLRNPMYDVAYFLASSLPVEDRRQHEKHLLARYLETLGERMSDYDEGEALRDCRLFMIASLTINILSTALLPQTHSVDQLILTLLERATAATEDWDGLASVREATS